MADITEGESIPSLKALWVVLVHRPSGCRLSSVLCSPSAGRCSHQLFGKRASFTLFTNHHAWVHDGSHQPPRSARKKLVSVTMQMVFVGPEHNMSFKLSGADQVSVTLTLRGRSIDLLLWATPETVNQVQSGHYNELLFLLYWIKHLQHNCSNKMWYFLKGRMLIQLMILLYL